jgi:hypothetical protein
MVYCNSYDEHDEPTCAIHPESGFFVTRELAVAAWNTRTPDPQLVALQWMPIDAEHLPKVGDEIWSHTLQQISQVTYTHVSALGTDPRVWKQYGGWTHFRPINAPEPSCVQGKENAS